MIPNIHVHTQYTEMSSIWYKIRLALVFIHILIFDEVKIMYSVSFTCCLIFDPYYYYVVLVLYVSCLFILNTFFYSLIYLHQSFVCVFRKMFVIKKGKYGWFYIWNERLGVCTLKICLWVFILLLIQLKNLF